MGLLPVSTQQAKNVRRGDTRRLVVAVFGVWALMIQSLLPTAGALAAQTGNGFLIELCTTAGLQTLFVSSDAAGDTERPAPSKSSAGCDVCVTCGCSMASSSCGGMASLPAADWIWVAWNMPGYGAVTHETPAGFQARGPPVT